MWVMCIVDVYCRCATMCAAMCIHVIYHIQRRKIGSTAYQVPHGRSANLREAPSPGSAGRQPSQVLSMKKENLSDLNCMTRTERNEDWKTWVVSMVSEEENIRELWKFKKKSFQANFDLCRPNLWLWQLRDATRCYEWQLRVTSWVAYLTGNLWNLWLAKSPNHPEKSAQAILNLKGNPSAVFLKSPKGFWKDSRIVMILCVSLFLIHWKHFFDMNLGFGCIPQYPTCFNCKDAVKDRHLENKPKEYPQQQESSGRRSQTIIPYKRGSFCFMTKQCSAFLCRPTAGFPYYYYYLLLPTPTYCYLLLPTAYYYLILLTYWLTDWLTD